jgi:hypothetical protein
MATTLTGTKIADTYEKLVKRANTYVQAGTNIEVMNDSAGALPTGLYLESGNTTDNVGIGTATPSHKLEIAGNSGANASLLVNSVASYDSIVYFGKAGSVIGIVGHDHGNDTVALVYDTVSASTKGINIASSGNVGIGIAGPGAHLDVTDTTVTTTAGTSYIAIKNHHIITGGDTDTGEHPTGINNHFEFNDTGESYGNLYGLANYVKSTETADEVSTGIYGFHNTAIIAGTHSHVSSIHGVFNLVDVDGGTVTSDIVGMQQYIDIDGGTIGASVMGLLSSINTTVNPGGSVILHYLIMDGAGTADADKFLQVYDDRTNDVVGHLTMAGVLTVDTSAADGASDYAEWFESKDGVAIEIGATVKLDNGKIVACEEGDVPMGVVRPADAEVVQAGGRKLKWQGKFLTDDYGSHIYEDCEWVIWQEAVDSVEYNANHKATGKPKYHEVAGEDGVPDTYYKEYSYYADRIPAGLEAPGDARIIPAESRRKRNPDYDESLEYVSREDRDEWYLIGLLGQVPITKGQPVASNWAKMNDISGSVEMWFVK